MVRLKGKLEEIMENKSNQPLQTKELEKLLQETGSIQVFQDQLSSQNRIKKLQYYLLELIEFHKKSPQDILNKANFSKSYYYKIINGEKHPQRDIILKLAILLNASLEETNLLLKYAKYAPLYVKDPRDAILYHGILKNLSLIELNTLLDNENHLLLD